MAQAQGDIDALLAEREASEAAVRIQRDDEYVAAIWGVLSAKIGSPQVRISLPHDAPCVGPTCLEAFRVMRAPINPGDSEAQCCAALVRAAVPASADAAQWMDGLLRAGTLLDYPSDGAL
jgi:hypothetical protein